MPLIKGGQFVDDAYANVADDAALPESGAFIVTLVRFRKERDSILARNAAIGVRLKSAESPELLGEDLQRFSVVALEFPLFKDGRAFSWARMMRTRLGFKGEIRGVGHFLYDQIAFMNRTGFDAFEVPDGFFLEQFKRALGEMSAVYQPSVDGRKTIRDLRANK
jgi:uncharacterized protein (DUF934 family)